MSRITKVVGRQILDSRSWPTVEVDVFLDQTEIFGRASVPSGASRGKHEAQEVRDRGEEYNGRGVTRAIDHVNKLIAPKLIGLNPRNQSEIDRIMIDLDGTKDKSFLGSNAILSVSLAVARAAANYLRQPLYEYLGGDETSPLPMPMMNVINGGAHANNDLTLQEFMIVPHAETFSEALRMGCEVREALKKTLSKKHGVAVGDEGGFAPVGIKNSEALELLGNVISECGYDTGRVGIALDCAASGFYRDGKYYIRSDYGMEARDLVDWYVAMQNNHGIMSFEDPFAEDDWEAWSEFSKKLPTSVHIVGDDLLVTSTERIQKALEYQACSAIIIKPNQVGTLTETVEAINYAVANGLMPIISHRSGETSDSFISHLAVAHKALYIKAGAPVRGERVEKYNELLRIEEHQRGQRRR